MDGIHDLGGKEGYGPIEIDDDESPFHEEWEGREWGIAQCARAPGITIDWWRHCRELIMPGDYLGRPYFDSWAQTDFSIYAEAGYFSEEEISSGKSRSKKSDYGKPAAAMTLKQVLREDHDHAVRFDGEIETPPVFAVGQQVKTSRHGNSGHTRLPQYARDRNGTVHAYHGAHLFPDLSAQGVEIHQHCYSIMFEAAELWPEARWSQDKVYLDLWESYLAEA
ncbi:MAG: nitrile hydratase subunit beta [Gammaproteobacteria bacterium]|nr:nitrile hydratase subunit beta [Gammaproteobacteria bacterium]